MLCDEAAMLWDKSDAFVNGLMQKLRALLSEDQLRSRIAGTPWETVDIKLVMKFLRECQLQQPCELADLCALLGFK